MQGLPASFDFAEEGSIVVLDDLMREGGKSSQVSDLFTRDSHHENLFIIMTSQNLFHQAKQARNITLNSQYYVLFKNKRDMQQISRLGNQLFPGDEGLFITAYKNATKADETLGEAGKHNYLLIDLHAHTNDDIILRSRFLPDEQPMECHVNNQVAAKRRKIEISGQSFTHHQ